MKLRRGVQWVLEVVAVMSFILIATTLDSEWNVLYLVFTLVNTAVFFGSSLILKKFGRWN